MSRPFVVIAAVTSLVFSAVAVAEEPAADFTTVVVAKGRPEDPFSSDRSLSVVGPVELAEEAPRTTPEALMGEPGTFVQATSRGGGSPILRGMIGPQVLILVDGVRLNNSVWRAGPVQYLNLVDPDALDRIEVLRGPASVTYGSDAMGGVLALTTLSPPVTVGQREVRVGGGVSGRYASADRGTGVSVRLRGGAAGFGAVAGGGLRSYHDLRAGGDVGRQPWTGYETASAHAGVTHRFGSGALEGWSVSGRYLFSRIDDAARTDTLGAGSLPVYDNEDHLAYVRLGMMLPATTGTVTVSFQDFFERMDNHAVEGDPADFASTTRDEVRVRTIGADARLDSRLIGDRLRLAYGGQYFRDFVAATRMRRDQGEPWTALASQNYPKDSWYQTWGLFLVAEGDPVSTAAGHVVRLSGGYRLSGMGGHAGASGDRDAVDTGSVGHTGHASAQYLWRERVNVGATWSQGFRAPNLQEAVMFGDSGRYFSLPNPDLGPERSDTVEVFARLRLWRVRLAATGWTAFLDDVIKMELTTYQGQAKVGGKDVQQRVNGGEGRLWGVETEAAVDIGSGLGLMGHLAWTWGEEVVQGGPDVPLSRIPPLFGQVTLRWDAPRAGPLDSFVELYVRAAGKQDRLSPTDRKDTRIPKGGTPGWATLNLRLGGTLVDRVRVGLAFENLTDAAYRYHGSGVDMPGFNVVASAAVDL